MYYLRLKYALDFPSSCPGRRTCIARTPESVPRGHPAYSCDRACLTDQHKGASLTPHWIKHEEPDSGGRRLRPGKLRLLSYETLVPYTVETTLLRATYIFSHPSTSPLSMRCEDTDRSSTKSGYVPTRGKHVEDRHANLPRSSLKGTP